MKRKRFPRAIEKAIYEKAKHLCQICGRAIQFDDGTLDHIVPLGCGGPDHPTNLQWACFRCNILKGKNLTNEDVRKILGLPENFEDSVIFHQKRSDVTTSPPPKNKIEHIKLGLSGLDVSEIEECKGIIHKTYQEKTIIPEAVSTVVHREISEDFVNIGFVHRLPRKWFSQERDTNFINDPVFVDYGHHLALTEREYLVEFLLKSGISTYPAKEITSEVVLQAIKEMHALGSNPDIFWPTIDCYTDMHSWKKASVTYSNEFPRPTLDPVLNLEDQNLKIIPPLGRIPKNPLLIMGKAIKWHVKSYDKYGATYIELGNDRLYPLRYVELIAVTTVKLQIDPKGIMVLEEQNKH